MKSKTIRSSLHSVIRYIYLFFLAIIRNNENSIRCQKNQLGTVVGLAASQSIIRLCSYFGDFTTQKEKEVNTYYQMSI